ncbi:hypothetical protein V8C86DRAFT_2644080 [Haematococcus lacustris]
MLEPALESDTRHSHQPAAAAPAAGSTAGSAAGSGNVPAAALTAAAAPAAAAAAATSPSDPHSPPCTSHTAPDAAATPGGTLGSAVGAQPAPPLPGGACRPGSADSRLDSRSCSSCLTPSVTTNTSLSSIPSLKTGPRPVHTRPAPLRPAVPAKLGLPVLGRATGAAPGKRRRGFTSPLPPDYHERKLKQPLADVTSASQQPEGGPALQTNALPLGPPGPHPAAMAPAPPL